MKRMILIVALAALGTAGLEAAITCVKCPRVAACVPSGTGQGAWEFCGSYDMDNPQQCRRTTRQRYDCLGGGTSYNYNDQYMVGYVCISGSDCY